MVVIEYIEDPTEEVQLAAVRGMAMLLNILRIPQRKFN
jgi:hypothetical protein